MSSLYRWFTLLLLLFCTSLFAKDNGCCDGKHQLNQIGFTESAERWVVAEKALVTMGVDANLTETGLSSLQDDVMTKLKSFSKDAKWRITQNYRRQDQSGLESVHIEAQARLPESQLASLRENAKKVSKPGFKVKVDNIEYRPTNAEIETIKGKVRDDLYQKVKAEIDRLNRIYPKQTYFVNQLVIAEGDMAPVPRAMAMGATEMMKQARVAPQDNSAGVSRKIKLTASVLLASQIDDQKIPAQTEEEEEPSMCYTFGPVLDQCKGIQHDQLYKTLFYQSIGNQLTFCCSYFDRKCANFS